MKKIKGFTLIELIIVMAILSILMVGIMQMMKPIRDTFVDSTYYESQRNTQNGIVTYLTESLRFATKMGIYNEQTGVTGVQDAINDFITSTGYVATEDGDINIIVIDNKTQYKFNNGAQYGRLLRSKTVNPSTGAVTYRVALGEAYYDKYTYSINVTTTGDADKKDSAGAIIGKSFTGLKVEVSSLIPSSLNQAKKNNVNQTNDILGSGYKCVTTEGEVNCLNLSSSIGGQNVTEAKKAGTSTTANGKNTYIIYTLLKEKP